MNFTTITSTLGSLLAIAIGASAILIPSTGHSEPAKWAPYPVEIWKEAFNMEGPRETAEYTPIEVTNKPWNLCISLPHMKDSYWLAVNFGLVDELKRLQMKAKIVTAGGYENLEIQKKQIANCITEKPDAIIIGAISATGLNDVIDQAHAANIPVIDLVNGISSDKLSAKSLVSFADMGEEAAKYIKSSLTIDNPQIAWFPGPEGAGWVAAGNKAFQSTLKQANIPIIDVQFGDTTPEVQRKLVTAALDAHKGINVIAGTAVTADIAVDILKKRGRKDIQIVSYYMTPDVYRHIRRGKIAAGPTDSPVIQARIAVDQAARILEGTEFNKHVGPKIQILDSNTVNFFEYLSALPPRRFKPEFTVQ